jgi:hypothetical protein
MSTSNDVQIAGGDAGKRFNASVVSYQSLTLCYLQQVCFEHYQVASLNTHPAQSRLTLRLNHVYRSSYKTFLLHIRCISSNLVKSLVMDRIVKNSSPIFQEMPWVVLPFMVKKCHPISKQKSSKTKDEIDQENAYIWWYRIIQWWHMKIVMVSLEYATIISEYYFGRWEIFKRSKFTILGRWLLQNASW